MKTLLIMRHAKSSRDDLSLADHERPLNDRGRRDAPLAGIYLAEAGLVPQHILASSAVRTRQTAEAVVEACDYRGSIDYLDALYVAPPSAYLAALRSLPEDVSVALVIGHNPAVEDLLRLLTGRTAEMPTTAVAWVALQVEAWSALQDRQEGELVHLWTPKAARGLITP